MAFKQSKHIFTGMSRDLSDDKQKAEFYIDAHNIRITAREDTTLLSVTNEKGNKRLILEPEDGINYYSAQYVGHAVLNDYLILFVTNASDNHPDTIWRVNLKTLKSKRLFNGDLNFQVEHPIETLVDYETEQVQKVYWTDGENQPRVINIMEDYTYSGNGIDSQFDFVPEIVNNQGIDNLSVSVEKLTGTEGMFAAGTLQYFITYYNKFGQESNVVWQSPLLYTSPQNRGGSPTETISNSFELTITGATDKFDFVRIYSVQHTSEDTDLIAKRVIDLPISSNIVYVDNGTTGESIVPSDLYYKGGVPTAIGTMAAKDQTLFLGNITLTNKQRIAESVKNEIKNLSVIFELEAAYPAEDANGKLYEYYNQLNENGQTQLIPRPQAVNPNATWTITHCIASYKYLEIYRFGLQFQDKWGRWSEPVFIGDFQNTVAPEIDTLNGIPYIYLPVAYIGNALSQESLNTLTTDGYINVRPLVVLPGENERECVAQGVVCPTVYNLGDRKTNSPYAQPSWFFRPYEGAGSEYGMELPYKHNAIIQGKTSEIAEIEKSPEMQIPPTVGATWYDSEHPDWGLPGIGNTIYANEDLKDSNFFVDQSLITLNSPDLEFNTNFTEAEYGFRVVGIIDVTGFTGSMQLQTSNAPNNLYRTEGFGYYTDQGTQYIDVGYGEPKIKEVAEGYLSTYVQQYNISNGGWGIMGSGGWWFDTPYTEWVTFDSSSSAASHGYIYPSGLQYRFKVFPWQSTGSLNNTSNKTHFETAGVDWQINNNTADLQYKCLANLRYSAHTKYLTTEFQIENNTLTSNLLYEITDVQVADPEINDTLQLQGSNDRRIYYCNIDKLLPAPENTVRQMLSQLTYSDYSIYNDPVFKKVYDWDIIIEGSTVSPISESPNIYSGYTGGVLRKDMALHIHNGGGLLRYYGSGSGIQPGTQIQNNAILSTKTTATSITYRSNRHAVINLSDYDLDTYTVLPRIKFTSNGRVVNDLSDEHWSYGIGAYNEASQLYPQVGNNYVWSSYYNNTAAQKLINISDSDFQDRGVLLLGEIYRKSLTNKYGGTTDDAIQQNVWIPAGKSERLNNINSLTWKEGDTYFQRYDCLKTYPYSNESENNIVEILSFMCETRINIAGRYDKNRGLLDNTLITNENFNLLNFAYNQKDNFFSYRILDNRFDVEKFKTQLTWSKVKSAGALIDNWTSISLANALDLDGDKGELISLNRYKNDVLAFQPKGISQIIYNPNVQVSTNSGIPIELANSGKVQGKRYLYEGIGCQNKWSICDEVYGSLYFIDNLAQSIYKLNENGLISLTDTKGFKEWMHGENIIESWYPFNIAGLTTREKSRRNFRVFYDKTYKDVYFVNNKTALVYSDLLDQFISFMDYQNTDGMLNANGSFYAVYNGYVWKQFDGPYNNIYNVDRNYSITFIDNQNPEISKIFSNLEFRSDTYDSHNAIQNFETFDTVRVYNEYQDTGEQPINKLMEVPQISSLQKKFRIWRVQIPRDKGSLTNRISNTWAKFTLKKNVTALPKEKRNHKTELHDSIVGYYF